MNVVVHGCGTHFEQGQRHQWDNATVTFDTTVLQVVHGAETTTFPLCNVLSFTTSDSGPS